MKYLSLWEHISSSSLRNTFSRWLTLTDHYCSAGRRWNTRGVRAKADEKGWLLVPAWRARSCWQAGTSAPRVHKGKRFMPPRPAPVLRTCPAVLRGQFSEQSNLGEKYLFIFFLLKSQGEEELGWQSRREICLQQRTKHFIRITLGDQQGSHVAGLQLNIYLVPLIYRHTGIHWTVSVPCNSFTSQCASRTFAPSHHFPASWRAA